MSHCSRAQASSFGLKDQRLAAGPLELWQANCLETTALLGYFFIAVSWCDTTNKIIIQNAAAGTFRDALNALKKAIVHKTQIDIGI